MRPIDGDKIGLTDFEIIMCNGDYKEALKMLLNKIDNAPTIAQPEIIHCRDCKHWMPYDWMFSEVWKSKNIEDYPEEEIGCTYCDMHMSANDFCSRGEKK